MQHDIKSILFVCAGNVCRSPMAECMFKHLLQNSTNPKAKEIRVSSAGTEARDGYPATEYAKFTMKLRGLSLDGFRSTQLTADLVKTTDLILAMEDEQMRAILDLVPEAEHKMQRLREFAELPGPGDIEDPRGRGPAEYERLANNIEASLIATAGKLDLM